MNIKFLSLFTAVTLFLSLQSNAEKKKIITLGSAATEIVFELGLGSEVVARDYGSIFPKEVLKLPSIGADHKFKAEDILKYRPTHIIVDDRRGTHIGLIEKMKKASISVIEIKISKSVDETKAAVKQVAKAFGVDKKGEELVDKINGDLKKVAEYCASKKNKPKAIFIYARGLGTLMLAGEKTSAEELLTLAGAEPCIKGFSGYKPINAEKIIESNPEAIMLFDSGLESLGGVAGLSKIQGLKLTSAVKEGKVVTMDDRSTNLGPRVGLFAMELAKKLYGDIEPLKTVNE